MPRIAPCAVLALFLAGRVAAQDGACPAGSLLAGAKPSLTYDAWDAERATDGVVAVEGDPWMSDVNTLLSPVGAIVYRLDAPSRVRAVLIQADGDDEYVVAGSLDGREWRTLWKVPQAGAPGMRLRYEAGLDAEVSWLRVRVARGDAASSIGEIAAYCRPPEPFPPALPARRGVVRDDAWQRSRDRGLAWGKALLAALGGIGLFQLARSRERGSDPPRWLSVGIPGALIAAGAFAWTSFGTFHGSGVLHNPEMFHYILGSKYFQENRYTELYRCTEIAEVELGRGAFVERRVIRDLATNRLEPAAKALENDAPCRTAFTAERWKEFKQDVEFFRASMYPGSWGALFLDHGYNPSPVWNLAGSRLTNLGSLARRPGLLAWIDALFYAGMLALVFWAFGLEACAAVAWFWGLGYPWDYSWTGGAFSRADWLFLAVAALCLVKKGWPKAAGFALGWSALLRVFPAAFAGGLAVMIGRDLVRKRAIAPEHRRFVLGGLLSLAVLVPLSLLPPNGAVAWKEFVDNSAADMRSPAANFLGLPALLAWHPDRTQEKMLTGQLEDHEAWEAAHRATYESRKLLDWAAAAILVALVAVYAAKYAKESWEAISASTLLAIALFQLACYYYAFLVLLVPLAIERARRIPVLAAALVGTQLIFLAGFSNDTRFAMESLLLAALSTYVVTDVTLEARKTGR